jgi:hypothetical protein
LVKKAIDSFIKADDPSAYIDVVDVASKSVSRDGMFNNFYFIFSLFCIISSFCQLSTSTIKNEKFSSLNFFPVFIFCLQTCQHSAVSGSVAVN